MENITTVNATLNETAKNATGREAATTEGLVVAYSSLILMAVLPIFFGSFRSVLHYRKQKVCPSCVFYKFRYSVSSSSLHLNDLIQLMSNTVQFAICFGFMLYCSGKCQVRLYYTCTNNLYVVFLLLKRKCVFQLKNCV